MSKKILSDFDFTGGARITNLSAPVAASEPVRLSDLNDAVEGLKHKDPARVSTQANTNLASPGATIDGVTMTSGDRVLVRNQTSQPENGIYLWNGSSSAMTRSIDASTAVELTNALVAITEGTDAGINFRQTTTIVTIGVTNVTFATFGTAAPAATETTAGIAELATQVETDTGTDDARIVTPLKLTTWSGKTKRFSQSFGDGSATQYDITHNLGTRDVVVNVARVASPYDTVECDISRLDANTVRLNFVTAPTSNQYRAVIVG